MGLVCAGMVGGGAMGRIPTVPLERQTWADGLVLGHHPVATVDWTKGAPDPGGGNIGG